MKTKKTQTDKETYLAKWLEGELSDAELQKRVSEEDFLLFKIIKNSFDQVEKPAFDSSKAYQKLKNKLQVPQQKIRSIVPNWVYSAVAVFVLAFGVFRFYKASVEVHTSYGETWELVLNEGTQVHLNNQSSLRYSKYQSQRELLLNGEAFFKVTKKGPFKVTTPLGSVEVLGTEFNVIADNAIFEVICYEGSVRVYYNGIKTTLKPSEAWRVIDGKTPQTWTTDETSAGWLSGESSFKSMPVSFVLKALEKQYHIRFKTTNLADSLLFTGSFPNDNLEKALRSVCLPLQIEYKIIDNQTVLLHSK